MRLDHHLISCDDHLDLDQLPADLWTSRLPADLRSRAPQVETRDGRAVWVCEGEVWGSWSGDAPPPSGPKPAFTAFDRGNVAPSERRAAIPELRLADMDRDGVFAHVIYGPVFSIVHPEAEVRDACYRAYNDWLADFCSIAPDRLLGVPMLPPNPESAATELRRLIDNGAFRQANLQIAEVDPPIRDPRWEPLFEMFAESGWVLSFHVAVFPKKLGIAYDPHKGSPGATFWAAKAFPEQFLDPFVDLFAFGILERHPGLKIVMAESGAGWLPWLVEELDYRHWRLWEAAEYWEARGGIPLVTKPSELFKRQIYITFQQSPVAMRLLEFFGDNLLWASDYPHPDSIWPKSHATIAETMGHLPADTIRRLTRDNAARLYKLDHLVEPPHSQRANARGN
ncbi:MAG TPA: amidohydrolase family protein [Allosphingosinicella sp.]|nr:amidohydrolase family protein [Allosphingosinicella sp.]